LAPIRHFATVAHKAGRIAACGNRSHRAALRANHIVAVQFAAGQLPAVVALLISAQNPRAAETALNPGAIRCVINNDIRQIGVSFDSLRNDCCVIGTSKSVSGAVTPPWQSGGSHQTMRRSSDREPPRW